MDLRRTARRLRSLGADRPRDRYELIHHAARKLVPLDAISIGLFTGDLMVVPYSMEHDIVESPDVLTLDPGTVCRWVRDEGRTYRFADDGGAMLGSSVPFGDGSEASRDAVFAPIRATDGSVRGALGVHSLRPHVYGACEVRAIEALAVLLGREEHPGTIDPGDADLYREFPEFAPTETDLLDRLHEAASLVAHVRRGLEEAAAGLPEADEGLRPTLSALAVHCAEASTWLAALATEDLRTPQPGPTGAAPDLTPREREIAQLIVAEGLSNDQIAERLFISVKTVKTHVGSILRKCGQTQRSGIALVMGA